MSANRSVNGLRGGFGGALFSASSLSLISFVEVDSIVDHGASMPPVASKA